MTFGRLLLAWLPVTLEFAVARWAIERRLPAIPWLAAEALVVTLFASLWFDSLGHGGWWLLFALVGLVAGFPARLQGTAPGAARRTILLGLLDTARYVVAGGILAWRLG